jgi:hypothetical protein
MSPQLVDNFGRLDHSLARQVTPAGRPFTFTVADAMAATSAGPYDVITCVDTIHHLSLTQALAYFLRRSAHGQGARRHRCDTLRS